jgi:hypothetical protein
MVDVLGGLCGRQACAGIWHPTKSMGAGQRPSTTHFRLLWRRPSRGTKRASSKPWRCSARAMDHSFACIVPGRRKHGTTLSLWCEALCRPGMVTHWGTWCLHAGIAMRARETDLGGLGSRHGRRRRPVRWSAWNNMWRPTPRAREPLRTFGKRIRRQPESWSAFGRRFSV